MQPSPHIVRRRLAAGGQPHRRNAAWPNHRNSQHGQSEHGRPAGQGTPRLHPAPPGQPVTIGPLPTTHAAAAAAAAPLTGHAARHGGTARPGGLLAGAAPVASPQLGAFVRRSIVVAPPRVSVRPAELMPATGGPPIPTSVRNGSHASGGSHTGTARPSGPAGHGTASPAGHPHTATYGHAGTHGHTGGPVIRRSLSSSAHALFRSLLGSQPASSSADAVLAESNGMFDNTPGHQPAVIRRFRQSGHDPDQFDPHQPTGDELSPAMQARDFDELIDRIVAKLEHRILEDLERRGRRGIPEVF
jgi:hypothetical protein